jgi:hypothetical protein
MTRNGKIARLPEQIREQINCRLQNGENGRQIIAWLNSDEGVKALLAQGFDGHEINDTNLSQWKKGGFRDWQARQYAMDEARRVMAEGTELAETANNALADKLAVWLVGRYIVVTRKLIENEDDAEAWKLLRELCHDVVALRRGEHGAAWLRFEEERIKLLRQRNARERKQAKLASQPALLPALSDEEKEQKFSDIFGTNPV